MKKVASGIFLFNSDNKFLVEHPTNHDPNFWSIPKGMVEQGEDLFEAAKRETLEETALDINTIQYTILGELPIIKFKSKRKSLKSFVLRTNEDLSNFKFRCDSMVEFLGKKKLETPFPEVDGYQWISIEEAYDLLHESQVRLLDAIKYLI